MIYNPGIELVARAANYTSVREDSRRIVFEQTERAALRPRPERRYQFLCTGNPRRLIEAILEDRAITELVTPADIGRVVDPDDDLVIATAIAARAGIIVSGNRGVLAVGQHRGIDIVSRADAAARIDRATR